MGVVALEIAFVHYMSILKSQNKNYKVTKGTKVGITFSLFLVFFNLVKIKIQ